MSNKKLECWANVYKNDISFYIDKEGAKAQPIALNRDAIRTAVHLREVPTPEEIERFRSVLTNDGLVFKSDYDALLRAYAGEEE